MPFKVRINWDLCIADGVCYALCPQVYEAGPDGKPQIVKEYRGSQPFEGTIPDELKDCADQGRIACPVGAISIE
ncbi:MAG: ferredoxin [Sulfolobales archaeon]|nr:ferredoxin [Sulfolobales archaeon]MCX8209319.1 ferredoxin [Sulfolobales archaeon]MDW8010131.1 ferredoxin [Sulfolobales archaeon]